MREKDQVVGPKTYLFLEQVRTNIETRLFTGPSSDLACKWTVTWNLLYTCHASTRPIWLADIKLIQYNNLLMTSSHGIGCPNPSQSKHKASNHFFYSLTSPN